MLSWGSLFHFVLGGVSDLESCGILVPQPGIEPLPPALEAWHLNHWTIEKSLGYSFLKQLLNLSLSTRDIEMNETCIMPPMELKPVWWSGGIDQNE